MALPKEQLVEMKFEDHAPPKKKSKVKKEAVVQEEKVIEPKVEGG